MPISDEGWNVVRAPHTDRVIEGVIHKYIRDLQGDLIDVSALEKRMPEIAQNAVMVYKHGRDPQRGVVPLGPICAWRRNGDEILIRGCVNQGNEIVDDIWKEEMVPMNTRAGFSIGGGTRKEAKACRMEAGRKMCDISDVIICEISWTPNPANPGALLRWGNWMAKGEEPEQKQVGAILGTVASGAVGAIAGAGSKPTTGSTGVKGDEEEKNVVKGNYASGMRDGKYYDENSPEGRDPTPSDKYNDEVRRKRESTLHDPAGKAVDSWGKSAEKKNVVKATPSEPINPQKIHEALKRRTPAEAEADRKFGAEVDAYNETHKCDCGKDDCEDCKKRELNKETSDVFETHIKSLYSHIPSRVVAEEAVQGCGTCDDYVAHLVRNEGMGTAKAMLKLQNQLDAAWEVSQKTVKPEEKKLPKETDETEVGKPMSEKDEKEKAQKSLEDRLASLEKAIADLASAKKEGGGFAAPQIGGGAGPLVGVAGSTPENIDQTNMATTKAAEVFAKSEEEALVKLVKAGYNVQGFQKGTPPVAPSQGGSPSGIDKTAVQKMALETSSIQRNVMGWANKKVG